MKKIFTLLLLSASFCKLSAQGIDILQEDFNYSPGTLTAASSAWTAYSGAGNAAIQVTSPGLSYSGYSGANPATNKITIVSQGGTASQEDVYRDFGAKTSGSLYISFLLNLTDVSNLFPNSSATGAYFVALLPSNSTSNFVSRLSIRTAATAGKYNLGIRPGSSSTVTWGANELDPGTTYLIVMRYSFVSGAGNDAVDVWINPSLVGTTPPAATFSSNDWTSSTEQTDISRLVVRQAGGAAASTPSASIDGFRVGTDWTNAPLPVSLLSFNASLNNKLVNLDWSTANEVNAGAFELERSVNGKDFSRISFVVAKNGVQNSYNFVDERAVAGTNYYRLKMVDKDGSFKYSQIVSVKAKSEGVAVFPNPVKANLTVQHEVAVKGATISVVDFAGKQVAAVNVQAGATQTNLDASKFTPGSYMIVFNNDGVKLTKQFVKQ